MYMTVSVAALSLADNCISTACVFDDMVGGFETVRCKKLQCQCKGFVPTVQIDNTDGEMVRSCAHAILT